MWNHFKRRNNVKPKLDGVLSAPPVVCHCLPCSRIGILVEMWHALYTLIPCFLWQNRQLLRDRFMVELVEGSRKLRHVFLFTDLLLCTKLKKQAAGWVWVSVQPEVTDAGMWPGTSTGLNPRWGNESDSSQELKLSFAENRTISVWTNSFCTLTLLTSDYKGS